MRRVVVCLLFATLLATLWADGWHQSAASSLNSGGRSTRLREPDEWQTLISTGKDLVVELPLSPATPLRLVIGRPHDRPATAQVTLTVAPTSDHSAMPPRHSAPHRHQAHRARPSPQPPGTAEIPVETTSIHNEWRVFDFPRSVTAADRAEQYTRFKVRGVSKSRRVRVFVPEESLSSLVTGRHSAEVCQLVEGAILPAIESLLGPIHDVDADGTLAVVFTPWVSRLSGDGTRLEGLTRFSDLQTDLEAPYSNAADVVFLAPDLARSDRLRAILAHEVAHLAHFSRRLETPSRVPQSNWISEGIAHLAEWRTMGSRANLKERVETFLSQSAATPLFAGDAPQGGRFRDPASRGAKFLFFDWVARDRENDFLRRVATADSSGTGAIEAATGEPFSRLFRGWSQALSEPAREADAILPVRWDSDRDTQQILEIACTAFACVEVSGNSSRRVTISSGGQPLQVSWRVCQ